MPRVTPFRLLLLLFCSWLALLAMWAFWPSLEIPVHERDGYIQHTFVSGSTLTTVYEIDEYLDGPDKVTYSQRVSPVSAFALDWSLRPDPKTKSLLLGIGEVRINLTNAVMAPKPYLSDITTVRGRTGDDHGIYLIWFTFADTILLDYELHHMDNDFELRVSSTKPGEVQIWKNTEEWDQRAVFASDELTASLATMSDAQCNQSLLATFSNIPYKENRSDPKTITIFDIKGLLPSQTFTIRRNVQTIIAPTVVVAFYLATTIIGPIIFMILYLLYVYMQIVAVYLTILFGCWLYHGRPHAVTWGREFWLSRWVFRKFDPKAPTTRVWGASGPVAADEEELDRPRQPQPLRNPLDFFRSPSPLDDLLCTFTLTQWMLRPIGNDSSAPRERSLESGRIVITTDEKTFPRG